MNFFDRAVSVLKKAVGLSEDDAPTYDQLRDRVAELEEAVAKAAEEAQAGRVRMARWARDKNLLEDRLRVALSWYADRANWRPFGLSPDGTQGPRRALEDGGARARRSLGMTAEPHE